MAYAFDQFETLYIIDSTICVYNKEENVLETDNKQIKSNVWSRKILNYDYVRIQNKQSGFEMFFVYDKYVSDYWKFIPYQLYCFPTKEPIEMNRKHFEMVLKIRRVT